MKSFSLFFSTVAVSSISLCLTSPISFEYKYKVVGDKNHPFSIQEAYQVKERLIDKYEELVFEYNEKDYQTIIKNNIKEFEFIDDCKAYYNGQIVIIIGNGTGVTLSGDLRRNICDENVIREKFYIFELFN